MRNVAEFKPAENVKVAKPKPKNGVHWELGDPLADLLERSIDGTDA